MATNLVPSTGGSSRSIAIKRSGALAKHAAKKHAAKAAKHAAKKHAAKHAAKKHAEKHAAKKHAKKAAKHISTELVQFAVGDWQDEQQELGEAAVLGSYAEKHVGKKENKEKKHNRKLLTKAFHHLQRASAVISLIEPDSGGDLKMLLHHGVELFREASKGKGHKSESLVQSAFGLLSSAEHLSMAGLYAARSVHQLDVEVPSTTQVEERLAELAPRLEAASNSKKIRKHGERLLEMAHELLQRAEAADHDPHLAYELVMAVDGLCLAFEAGLE